jgi:hypothetical protein
MEKKRVSVIILVLTILLLSMNFIFAANNTAESSYSCLKSQLGTNCGNTQNTQTAAFNLLAMSSDSKIQSNCKNVLNSNKNDNCFADVSSSDSCTIKSTALAIIALRNVGEKANSAVDWLIDRKKATTDLTWYLEIDSLNSTDCTVNGASFSIGDNKKISGSDPSGLVKAYNDYWFQILDPSINFTISCDNNFVTTLIYQKKNANKFYVSAQTHFAAASDSTNEKVESYCFTTSDTCDYEGSLWATLALQKAGEDTSPYIPYIIAMADETDNQKYLSYAFLYMLNHADDSYHTSLKNLQKQGKYWDESGNKFYDTAIALLALQSAKEDSLVSSTKSYLLTQTQDSGCWPSDTAFLLYSGWTKAPVISGSSTSNCEGFENYRCVSSSECEGISSTIDMYCPGTAVCCKNTTKLQSCSAKGGIICDSNQECTENTVIAGDTHECCMGSCKTIQTAADSECEKQYYSCKSSCSSGEAEKIGFSDSCPSGTICCAAAASSPSFFSSWTFIILLIVLILLLALAIIFRDKLKIWIFKMKSNFKSKPGPTPTTRPSSPPPSYRPIYAPRQRQIIPRQQQQTRPSPRPARPNNDKEFEETMKKLRDMSK